MAEGGGGNIPPSRKVKGVSLEDVLQGFMDHRLFDELSDFKVVGIDKTEYPVHRLVLAAHSEHFRQTIFSHPGNRECQHGKYVFSREIDPRNVIKSVINYMYTTEIELTPSNAVFVYRIADFLQMPNLVNLVQEYLSEVELGYFRADDLLPLPLELSVNILSSDQLRIKSEFQVYKFVEDMVRKIHQAGSEDARSLAKLWECVRFSQLTKQQFAEAISNENINRDLLFAHSLYKLDFEQPNIYPSLKYHHRAMPFSIRSLSVFMKDIPDANLKGLRVCMTELKNINELHGWVLTERKVVYGPTNLHWNSFQPNSWFTFQLKTPFQWNRNNLLIEFSRADPQFETGSEHASWQFQDFDDGTRSFYSATYEVANIENPSVKNLRKSTAVPKVKLKGYHGDMNVTLCVSGGKEVTFYSGPLNEHYKCSWIQSLFKWSDFQIIQDNS